MQLLPSDADMFLLGDLNVNFLASVGTSDRPLKQKLARFSNLHNLVQMIKMPTRITEHSSTMIDLLFVNNSHCIVDSGIIPVHLSDHSLIYGVLKAGIPRAPPRTIEYRSFKHFSKQAFLTDLTNVNWSLVDNEPDNDAAMNNWNTLFTETANQHAPIKKSRVKGIHMAWLTSELRSLMQQGSKVQLFAPLENV